MNYNIWFSLILLGGQNDKKLPEDSLILYYAKTLVEGLFIDQPPMNAN